jgi:hypothetical protein
LDLPVSWAVAVLLISMAFSARREIVKLVLGWYLIRRAEKADLPAIAESLSRWGGRK